MNLELIKNLGNILSIPSGVVAISLIISFLYGLLAKPKLRYTIKKYQLSENKYFYVCCLWNPLYKKIVKNNITKDISIQTFHKVEELNVLKYTDKSLEKIVSNDNEKISINFDEFPRRSGVIFTFKAGSYIHFKGELCNKENIIDSKDLHIDKSLYFNVAIWLLIYYLLPIKLNQFFVIACCFLLGNFHVFSFPYFTDSKPESLKKFYEGNIR